MYTNNPEAFLKGINGLGESKKKGCQPPCAMSYGGCMNQHCLDKTKTPCGEICPEDKEYPSKKNIRQGFKLAKAGAAAGHPNPYRNALRTGDYHPVTYYYDYLGRPIRGLEGPPSYKVYEEPCSGENCGNPIATMFLPFIGITALVFGFYYLAPVLAGNKRKKRR